MIGAVGFALALVSFAARAVSQEVAPRAEQARPDLPFGVGESFEYDIRVGFIRGSASLQILSLDTVRGRPAFHALSTTRGGIPGIRVNDRIESWIDVENVSTLRLREDLHQANYKRKRNYEFYPERGVWIEGRDTVETPERPVDQTSIIYLIRTLNLRVGLDTSFNNYFMVQSNPVRIIVLGRERVKVDAGEFDAFVVRPIIKTKGLFAEGGDARVWISDDDRRIVVQVKAKVPGFPFGGMNMYLKTYRPPTGR